MNELIVIAFIATLLLMLLLFFNAYENIYTKLKLLFFFLIIILFQGYITILDFYKGIPDQPYRMLLAFLPSALLIIIAFRNKSFLKKISSFSSYTMTYVFIIRIFIELILHYLSTEALIPKVMTYEGRNADILIGLSAPFVAYYGFKKTKISKRLLIAWNVLGMIVLTNVVVHGIMSLPTPFQQFYIDYNNFAILRLPFVLLPSVIVPTMYFCHILLIKRIKSQHIG